MILNKLFKRFSPWVNFAAIRNKSSQINLEKLEQESSEVGVIEDEAKLKEEEIRRKQNKSRLREKDRNLLLGNNPYPDGPVLWFHGTLKYNRRLYGRHGAASGVNPSICWPTKQELKDLKEYERVAYPFTIPDMIATAKEQRKQKEHDISRRQEEIIKKMEKLEEWTIDLKSRIAKKEADALAARERKERLVEEVRRHFGYTVDPRDEKFKEMLERKEKEQKKQMKEARRKAKEEKVVEKLLKQKTERNKSETIGSEGLKSDEKSHDK